MQPWVTGPAELLEHGLSLLTSDSDKNRRLAIIAIDNAVELAINTYLSLPKRVTGLTITRKEFAEAAESFPKLLDALDQHCSTRIAQIDLGEVEWYHRLRNQLYHQGNGLTVEREKVVVYAELARLLFRNLFGAEVTLQRSNAQEVLGAFLEAWVELERAIVRLARDYRSDLTVTGARLPSPMIAFDGLARLGIIRKRTARKIDYYRTLRNRIVHGELDHAGVLTEESVKEVRGLQEEISKLAESDGEELPERRTQGLQRTETA